MHRGILSAWRGRKFSRQAIENSFTGSGFSRFKPLTKGFSLPEGGEKIFNLQAAGKNLEIGEKSVKKVLTKLDSCGILTELSAQEQLKPLTQ